MVLSGSKPLLRGQASSPGSCSRLACSIQGASGSSTASVACVCAADEVQAAPAEHVWPVCAGCTAFVDSTCYASRSGIVIARGPAHGLDAILVWEVRILLLNLPS